MEPELLERALRVLQGELNEQERELLALRSELERRQKGEDDGSTRQS